MKVAISLPDPLFDAAEQLALELGVSRSQLYARALAALLEQRNGASITAQLNEVYDQHGSGLEPAFASTQLQLLADEAW